MARTLKALSYFVSKSLGAIVKLECAKAGYSFEPRIKHFYQFPLIFKCNFSRLSQTDFRINFEPALGRNQSKHEQDKISLSAIE